MDTTTAEIWVLIDDNGEYVAHVDPDQLNEVYDSDVGGDSGRAKRKIKIVLTVPLPKPIELVGTVPAESEEGGELKVA